MIHLNTVDKVTQLVTYTEKAQLVEIYLLCSWGITNLFKDKYVLCQDYWVSLCFVVDKGSASVKDLVCLVCPPKPIMQFWEAGRKKEYTDFFFPTILFFHFSKLLGFFS